MTKPKNSLFLSTTIPCILMAVGLLAALSQPSAQKTLDDAMQPTLNSKGATYPKQPNESSDTGDSDNLDTSEDEATETTENHSEFLDQVTGKQLGIGHHEASKTVSTLVCCILHDKTIHLSDTMRLADAAFRCTYDQPLASIQLNEVSSLQLLDNANVWILNCTAKVIGDLNQEFALNEIDTVEISPFKSNLKNLKPSQVLKVLMTQLQNKCHNYDPSPSTGVANICRLMVKYKGILTTDSPTLIPGVEVGTGKEILTELKAKIIGVMMEQLHVKQLERMLKYNEFCSELESQVLEFKVAVASFAMQPDSGTLLAVKQEYSKLCLVTPVSNLIEIGLLYVIQASFVGDEPAASDYHSLPTLPPNNLFHNISSMIDCAALYGLSMKMASNSGFETELPNVLIKMS